MLCHKQFSHLNYSYPPCFGNYTFNQLTSVYCIFIYTYPDQLQNIYMIGRMFLILLDLCLMYGLRCELPSGFHNPLIQVIVIWPLTLINFTGNI